MDTILHICLLFFHKMMHDYAMWNPQIPSTLAHTNRLYHSFVPSSIRLWNSLNLDTIGVMGTPACRCGARCETTHHYISLSNL